MKLRKVRKILNCRNRRILKYLYNYMLIGLNFLESCFFLEKHKEFKLAH